MPAEASTVRSMRCSGQGATAGGLAVPGGVDPPERVRPAHWAGGIAPATVAAVALRVVLAEDSLLVREGVRALLELEDGIEVVGVAEDLAGLLACVASLDPDVVLTDIRMPPQRSDEGIRAALALRATNPDTAVVVLSQYLEPSYAVALFEAGAEGRAYLLKERLADAEQLVSAIREVARGGSVIDPKVVDVLVASGTGSEPFERLSPREQETLAEMAAGHSNAAIATRLGLSDRAVEKHIGSVFAKLGLSEEPTVHRRVKAVLMFLAAQRSATA